MTLLRNTPQARHDGPRSEPSQRTATGRSREDLSKRILIVCQYYWPEGPTYAEDLALGLTQRGHRVRVITGYPNYPDGKLYPGYRQRWRSKERIRGIPVLRVPLFVDHSASAFRRALNYLTFGFSSATVWEFAKDADVVYVYATQMTAAVGPWWWRLVSGKPFVLHVQDLWPDSIVGSSLVTNQLAANTLTKLMTPALRIAYRQAAAVVAIAPNMVTTLIRRGSAPDRTHLLYNWSNAADSVAAAAPMVPVPAKDARTRFIYAGNVGDMQDIATVIRAAGLCQDDDIEVLIVGDGIALTHMRELAAELRITNVKFTGLVPATDVPHFLQASDFGLVTLKDLPVFRGTVPSKLQMLLAHGLPIVTTVQGDVREIVESNDVGFAAEPEDPDALASAFREAAALSDAERAQLSNRSRAAYRRHFDKDTGIDDLERLLIRAADSRPTSKWETAQQRSTRKLTEP